MTKILCIDKNEQVRTFDYSVSELSLSSEWEYRVTTIPPLVSGEFFQLRVKEISPQTVRVVMLKHNDEPSYIAMGIPDKLLQIVKQDLSKNVESSPTMSQEGDSRNELATKVWDRLVAKNLASYDSSNDIYKLN